jgi:hypothetical protein
MKRGNGGKVPCILNPWTTPLFLYMLVTYPFLFSVFLFIFIFMTSNVGTGIKLFHCTQRWRLGGEEYNSYSFSTSALDGSEWTASRPDPALAPGKGPPTPIVQEAGWASEPVWTQMLQEKSFHLCRGSKLVSLVVQPVATVLTELPGSQIQELPMPIFSLISLKM